MMHFKEWLSKNSDLSEGVVNDRLMQMLMREVANHIKNIAKNSGKAFDTTFENIAGRLPIGDQETKKKVMTFININRPRSTDDDATIQERSLRIANFLIDQIEQRINPGTESQEAKAVKKEIGLEIKKIAPKTGMPLSADEIRKKRFE